MTRADRIIGTAQLLLHLTRHALRQDRVLTLPERLAMLPADTVPLDQPATIHWDDHQVPFIEASTDHDLAVALGMVHAHLRLGQIELVRRLSQGRLSEMIGPLGIDLDRQLRTLDVGRAVPSILAAMPQPTRAWLDGFVQGLNHYLTHATTLPLEFELFALRREAWTAADVLTMGRLVSADINWLAWLRLLPFRSHPDWPSVWRKLSAADSITFTVDDGATASLGATLRSGSNSFAVGPARTATGAPLIASDPHLSFILPNPWLVAAMKSPSYNVAGLMIPGLPFVALGRNPWIAWGGVSLHAASSDLVKLGGADIDERDEPIAVRWRSQRTVRIRDSAVGPAVAGDIALRWMGHRPSDEISAMLALSRAHDWSDFRAALDGFALPGQSMLYADTAGHIGRLMAVPLPRRERFPADDLVLAPEMDEGWQCPVTGDDLPHMLDPADGFIAGANERPSPCGVFIGHQFSSPDRKRRVDALLSARKAVSIETIKSIQADVQWSSALMQCRQLLAWFGENRGTRERRFVELLTHWNGRYDAGSRGALAFELVCHQLARRLISRRDLAIYTASWGTRRLIWNDVMAAESGRRTQAVRRAVHLAARQLGARTTWGDRHRLRLGHALAMVPVLGRRWRFTDTAVGGSSDTIMKTAHTLTGRRHAAGYGSVARHISDLSDLDRNYFVLAGGQDGWPGSTTFIDQVPLWHRGEYVTVPLRPDTARAAFRHRSELRP